MNHQDEPSGWNAVVRPALSFADVQRVDATTLLLSGTLMDEMTQLKERDTSLQKKVHEMEDEGRKLRVSGEKRLGEAEAQRSREMELHEKRIVKLMNVIEALTTAGEHSLSCLTRSDRTCAHMQLVLFAIRHSLHPYMDGPFLTRRWQVWCMFD